MQTLPNISQLTGANLENPVVLEKSSEQHGSCRRMVTLGPVPAETNLHCGGTDSMGQRGQAFSHSGQLPYGLRGSVESMESMVTVTKLGL